MEGNLIENDNTRTRIATPANRRHRRGKGERVVTSPLPVPGVDVWGDRNGGSHECVTFLPPRSPDETSCNHNNDRRKAQRQPPSRPIRSTSPTSRFCNASVPTQLVLQKDKARLSSQSSNDTDSSSNKERNIPPSFAIQWNICGLRTHQSELQILTTKYKPDVICLQETNVDYHRLSATFLGNKYQFLLSQCSAHGRQGAGMAIKSGTAFHQIPIHTNIQAIAVQLYAPTKMTVASVYLPPKDKDSAKLLSELLDELPKPVLLLGDLNAHHTAWGSRICSSASEAKKRGNEILELVVQHDMLVLNDGSHTRIDPASGASQALDVSICSTSIAAKFKWKSLPDCSDSDHLPILIDIHGTSNEPKHRPRWIYDKANWDLYEDITSRTLRPGHSLSVEEFSNRIISAAGASIPKTTGKDGSKAVVWWNTEVREAIKERRKRLRALRRLSTDDPRKITALHQFHKARSACRKTIQDAKQKSWEDFVESINPNSPTSQVWSNINRLQGKRKTNGITLNLPTGMTNDGQKVAEALADEYQTKSSDLP